MHLASGPASGKPKLRESIGFPHDTARETEAQREDDSSQSPNRWLSPRRSQVTSPIPESQLSHKVCQCRNHCCPRPCLNTKQEAPAESRERLGPQCSSHYPVSMVTRAVPIYLVSAKQLWPLGPVAGAEMTYLPNGVIIPSKRGGGWVLFFFFLRERAMEFRGHSMSTSQKCQVHKSDLKEPEEYHVDRAPQK